MKTRFGFAALISVLVGVSTASAADIAPVYKAPPPAASAVNWTGFFVGGNVGYAWGRSKSDVTANGDNISFPSSPVAQFNPNVVAVSGNLKDQFSGITGGAQAGYNWSIGRNLLLGVEADIFALHQRTNVSLTTPVNTTICGAANFSGCLLRVAIVGSVPANVQTSIEWIGTVRGRIGFRPSEMLLLYATGGLAYGNVRVNGNLSGSAILPIQTQYTWSGDNAFGSSTTKYGYALGGGIESKIANNSNWSWKLEYLYIDLGSINTFERTSFQSTQPQDLTDIVGRLNTHTRISENILRAGLNYTFDWGKAPVVAKY